eukprot:TRINITY_DN24308_c0_g1_i1.p1 TRINITY_DN24308_c0_g1~~TRINITY_DN24308_c0_g1_i1.p1  ORF type:complete len:239 (-),score=10.45 TRINITY_DN24308_c0_g1_i1:93-809(-)
MIPWGWVDEKVSSRFQGACPPLNLSGCESYTSHTSSSNSNSNSDSISSSSDSISNSYHHNNESYCIYDSIEIGQYTIQFWRVSSGCPRPPKDDSAMVTDSFGSYLPPGTNGLSVPTFPRLLKGSQTARTPSPYRPRSGPLPVALLRHYRSEPCLTALAAGGGDDGTVWQISLYKNGEIIEPKYDGELKRFWWGRRVGNWVNQVWNKKELCQIIWDLISTFGDEGLLGVDFDEIGKWTI